MIHRIYDKKRFVERGMYIGEGILLNPLSHTINRYFAFKGSGFFLEFDLDFYSKVFGQRLVGYSFRQTEDILRDEIEGKFMFPVFHE